MADDMTSMDELLALLQAEGAVKLALTLEHPGDGRQDRYLYAPGRQ